MEIKSPVKDIEQDKLKKRGNIQEVEKDEKYELNKGKKIALITLVLEPINQSLKPLSSFRLSESSLEDMQKDAKINSNPSIPSLSEEDNSFL